MNMTHLEYQRNGVGGEGFYHMFFTDKHKNKTAKFVITFTEQDFNPSSANSNTTARVVCISDPKACWRGDVLMDEARACIVHRAKLQDNKKDTQPKVLAWMIESAVIDLVEVCDKKGRFALNHYPLYRLDYIKSLVEKAIEVRSETLSGANV